MSTSGRNQSRNFYPRPPRGGRQKGVLTRSVFTLFLSTPSARRATYSRFRIFLHSGISIHALREEGDAPVMYRLSRPKYFYPRPPRGGRHISSTHAPSPMRISIHALREEGDIFTISYLFAFRHFYPRPPRGGRRAGHVQVIKAKVFLSTPSARRATSLNTVSRLISMISIHALREEGDQKTRIASGPRGRFLSTPSARRATALSSSSSASWQNFYPRPPRGGRQV